MPKIIITEDNSHTLVLDENPNVSYHSIFGAVDESNHVFINAGLQFILERKNEPIHILEIGYGTGLNALLTLLATKNKKIFYNTIEPNLIESSILEQINYGAILNAENEFKWLHQCEPNTICKFNETFEFLISNTRLENFMSTQKFDLVYFDAFAPTHQPELWTNEMFAKIFALMNKQSVLVTYCSKGIVQRSLKQVGFILEKLPGPKRKREMIRAIKP